MKSFSSDDLAKLSNDDLKRHFIEVRGRLNKQKRTKQIAKDLEVYYCYVIRELEHRNARVQR